MTAEASALVAVIIVNWNGRQHLEGCLAALFAQPLDCVRVIMVDNGSTDDSCAWAAAYYPQVEIIRLPRNFGFAAANNLGIAATTARYVITLNNDTEIEPGWIESLIEAAESDPTIGSCASRIVLAARPDRLDSAGISVDRFGFAWQRGRDELDTGLYRQTADVWGASAAAALYRRDMLDRIGLFDEEFGSYYEDVDQPGALSGRAGAAATCPIIVCSTCIQRPVDAIRITNCASLPATVGGR